MSERFEAGSGVSLANGRGGTGRTRPVKHDLALGAPRIRS